MRKIPKVDKILCWPAILTALAENSRPVVLNAIRSILDDLRTELKINSEALFSDEAVSLRILAELDRSAKLSLQPLVNGTGVVLHTNLGRSLLSKAACSSIQAVATHYSNLETDLSSGERGERYSHVESLICDLTGAEAALVVNNNAAALLLALSALAQRREVLISRGELVEIGGSFRIPDVMTQSGAIIREVGTTNRTHSKDYLAAITSETALLMKVHASNFAVVGYTAEVSATELAALGHLQGIPVVADIGSGSLMDLSRFGINGEPTIQELVRAGVDLITFSGDKLLGGPQAGIIVGREEIMAALRVHPLLRALRIDKLTLAALEATLRHYRDEREALAEIPTLRMLILQPAALRKKGMRYLRYLRALAPSSVRLALENDVSQVGGGALPLAQLPTYLISVECDGWSAQGIDRGFRRSSIPVVGRINKSRYLLDLRTLQDDDLPALAAALLLLAVPPPV